MNTKIGLVCYLGAPKGIPMVQATIFFECFPTQTIAFVTVLLLSSFLIYDFHATFDRGVKVRLFLLATMQVAVSVSKIYVWEAKKVRLFVRHNERRPKNVVSHLGNNATLARIAQAVFCKERHESNTRCSIGDCRTILTKCGVGISRKCCFPHGS